MSWTLVAPQICCSFFSTLFCVLRVDYISGLLVRFSRRWESGESKVGYLFLSFFPRWAWLPVAILFNWRCNRPCGAPTHVPSVLTTPYTWWWPFSCVNICHSLPEAFLWPWEDAQPMHRAGHWCETVDPQAAALNQWCLGIGGWTLQLPLPEAGATLSHVLYHLPGVPIKTELQLHSVMIYWWVHLVLASFPTLSHLPVPSSASWDCLLNKLLVVES